MKRRLIGLWVMRVLQLVSGGLGFCPAADNIHSLAAVKAMELSARRHGCIVLVEEVLDER